MKKTLQIVYIAVFLLLCCVPMVLKPFWRRKSHRQ